MMALHWAVEWVKLLETFVGNLLCSKETKGEGVDNGNKVLYKEKSLLVEIVGTLLFTVVDIILVKAGGHCNRLQCSICTCWYCRFVTRQ